MATFTISGFGFSEGEINVFIGGVAVTDVIATSDTTVTGTLPLLSTGTKDVVITKNYLGITQTDTLVGAITYTSSIVNNVSDDPINATFQDILQKTAEITDGSNIMTLTGTALPLTVTESSVTTTNFSSDTIIVNGEKTNSEYSLEISGNVKLNENTFIKNPNNWFSRDPINTSNPSEPPRSKYQLARTYSVPDEYMATFMSNVGFIDGSDTLGGNNGVFTATQNKYSKNNIAGAIGLGVFGTNNHIKYSTGEYLPGNPAPLWACYIEAKREDSTGSGYTSCVESEISNFGNEVRVTPANVETKLNNGNDPRVTYNIHLGVGAGDQYGVVGYNKSVSAGVFICSNLDGRADLVATNRHSPPVPYPTDRLFPASAEFICNMEINNDIAIITDIAPTYRTSEVKKQAGDAQYDVLIGDPIPRINEYIFINGAMMNTTILSVTPSGDSYICNIYPGNQYISKQPAVVSHSSRYLSGIVFDAYGLDPRYNEAIAMFSDHKINWYRGKYPETYTPGASIYANHPSLGSDQCSLTLDATSDNNTKVSMYFGKETNAITTSANATIGTSTSKIAQTWQSEAYIDKVFLKTPVPTKFPSNSPGKIGELRWGSASSKKGKTYYLFMCVADNSWRRVALSAF